jgi:hypothetical protein
LVVVVGGNKDTALQAGGGEMHRERRTRASLYPTSAGHTTNVMTLPILYTRGVVTESCLNLVRACCWDHDHHGPHQPPIGLDDLLSRGPTCVASTGIAASLCLSSPAGGRCEVKCMHMLLSLLSVGSRLLLLLAKRKKFKTELATVLSVSHNQVPHAAPEFHREAENRLNLHLKTV